MSNPWKDATELRKKLAEAGEGQRTREHEEAARQQKKIREEFDSNLVEKTKDLWVQYDEMCREDQLKECLKIYNRSTKH